MSRKKIIKRMLQRNPKEAGIFAREQDKERMRGRFFDNEDSDSDIDSIERNILNWCGKEEVDLVVIDHFHIINVGSDRKSFYESKTLLSGRLQSLPERSTCRFWCFPS